MKVFAGMTNDEIWKDVQGYEGLYQVSNQGRVKSLERVAPNKHCVEERILKFKKNRAGYFQVWLYKNNKAKVFLVHRLVAKTFIPNPVNLPQVNHIDENKINNCVSNLEWCTSKYNVNFGHRTSKMSKAKTNGKKSKPVFQFTLGGRLIKRWPSTHECGRHGFNQSVVAACCRNAYGIRKNIYKKFRWQYAEEMNRYE